MSEKMTASTKGKRPLGFGFDSAQSPYHFAVVVSRHGVTINERFAWAGDGAGAEPGASPDAAAPPESSKVILTPYLWDRIAGPAAAEFNRRLQTAGLRAGRWNKGETLLAPHFGKELTLLAWAVERQDADPTPIPAMIANWSGLAPEERWWFYTTINATAGHPGHPERGEDRGWRKAIKIAFAENPVQLPTSALLSSPPSPPTPSPPRGRGAVADGRSKTDASDSPAPAQGRLRLWDTEDTAQ